MDILLSLQPDAVNNIYNNGVSIILRKSVPKVLGPFKIYIYCSKGKVDSLTGFASMYGKVVGEVTCNNVNKYNFNWAKFTACGDEAYDISDSDLKKIGLSMGEVIDYATNSHKGVVRTLFGWQVTDFKLYPVPKDISDFAKVCEFVDSHALSVCRKCDYYYSESSESSGFYDECSCDGLVPLKRPPVNWCYVTDISD